MKRACCIQLLEILKAKESLIIHSVIPPLYKAGGGGGGGGGGGLRVMGDSEEVVRLRSPSKNGG